MKDSKKLVVLIIQWLSLVTDTLKQQYIYKVIRVSLIPRHLITCSICKNRGRRPEVSYHVICGTGVTFCITMLQRRLFCTSQEDETCTNIS